MMKNKLFLATALMMATSAAAQELPAGLAEYRMDDALELWHHTDNAAGLGLDSSRTRGVALFNAEHRSGDYARVQEGTQTNQLRFMAERRQTVGRYLHAYGRFSFDYGRTKNRAWADVLRPYNANPFFAGSSIPGKYDFQDFDFTAALGTTDFGGWRFGLKLDYKAGDLSRLRDPRSRTQLLDYKLAPAVAYHAGRHTVGLAASYHRRKEKITGVTTVQQDPTIKYYLMTGLEHAEGTTGGYSSFSREWVDHRFGAELSYAYKTATLHSLLAATIERGEENAYGQYKYEPGRYVDYRYGISMQHRVTAGSIVHQADLGLTYEQAFADEYRQQLEQTKDAETGYTSYHYHTLINFKKRYQVNTLHASLHYRAHFTQGRQERAYAGAEVTLNQARNKHLLPTSELKYGGTALTAEGGAALGRRLWIDAQAGGMVAKSPTLALADPTTEYAQQVLVPDMDFYRANYWRGRVALTYQFPLKLKGKTSAWFVRAYGDYLHTNNHLDAKTVGLSIGLYN